MLGVFLKCSHLPLCVISLLRNSVAATVLQIKPQLLTAQRPTPSHPAPSVPGPLTSLRLPAPHGCFCRLVMCCPSQAQSLPSTQLPPACHPPLRLSFPALPGPWQEGCVHSPGHGGRQVKWVRIQAWRAELPVTSAHSGRVLGPGKPQLPHL